MLDLATARQGPLEADATALRPGTAVELSVVPPCTKLVLRCRPDATAALGEALGLALPGTCHAVIAGDRAALWLGPDEWLLFADSADAATIERQAAVAPSASYALVDVSHRSAGITLTGPQAAALINHGCPLDLSSAAFPVGMCTRTLFDRAEIILWRADARTFRLEIERSFTTYVWRLLINAREALI